MPCYNSSAYVCNAVDSLLTQSYQNWELIAINDGSTDDTLNILHEYSKKDNRIKVYSKENGGYATAVNYGLDKVQGDYFLMMGSDDQLSSDLFEKIVDNIEGVIPDVIAFRAVKFVNGVRTCVDDVTNFDTCVSMNNTTINQFTEQYPQHSRILVERDTAKCFLTKKLGNLRYFGRYGYDSDGIFSALFVQKCRSFMSIPIDGYYWTLRSDSVSAKTNTKIDKDRLSNWIQYNEKVLSDCSYIPTAQERHYLCMANQIGLNLLENEKNLDFQTIRLIHKGRKETILAVKRYSIAGLFTNHRIRDFLFVYAPTLWTLRYRMRTKNKRKQKE